MQLLHWKVCAVRIGQNWPVCWKHPCCRVSRPPSGEHHPCLTFRALITYWIKRNSNLGLWKDSVWCTTHPCPLAHITDMFPQSRTVQVSLSFTFVLEKVHFLHRLEAEATSDTSTHYEHNAELKQGFKVGPEPHDKPLTTTPAESAAVKLASTLESSLKSISFRSGQDRTND